MNNKILFSLLIVVILAAIGAGIWLANQNPAEETSGIVQNTQEATNTLPEQPEVIQEPQEQQKPEMITSGINTSDWKTYRNEELGFTFTYPPSWSVSERKSKRLFSEIGPIGDMVSLASNQNNKNDSPFFVKFYRIDNPTNKSSLEMFDFVHSGDRLLYSDYESVYLNGDEFIFIKSDDSYKPYISTRNDKYFEIGYFEPGIENLSNLAKEVISNYRLLDQN